MNNSLNSLSDIDTINTKSTLSTFNLVYNINSVIADDDSDEDVMYQEKKLIEKRRLMNSYSSHMKVGIVGYVNIGKSSLFNLLGGFNDNNSTIDDDLFTTTDSFYKTFPLEDSRLEYLTNASINPMKSNGLHITFIDTLGLVENSFHGEGMGNKALSDLHNVDVVIHLLRGFDDENITHYLQSIDPIRDWLIVENEILIYDLNIIENAILHHERTAFTEIGGQYRNYEVRVLLKAWKVLAGFNRPEIIHDHAHANQSALPEKCTGIPLRYHTWDTTQLEVLSKYKLISSKEFMYILNVNEREYLRHRSVWLEPLQTAINNKYNNEEVILMSIPFENNIMSYKLTNELNNYFEANPTHSSMINTVVMNTYKSLYLIRFYTHINDEIYCWCSRYGKSILTAAAIVDINMARKFIRAEVISYRDFKKFNGDRDKLLTEKLIKVQGKKYIVNDGDIIEFKYKLTK